MPWKIVEEQGEHCVFKEDSEGNPSEKLKCYPNRDDALAYQRALYANTDEEMGEATQFVLLADMNASTVEFLRIGTFVDARGKKVEINDERLQALIANFEQGAAGQEVPIDILHKREEAAGWVQGIQRVGDKLIASVAWNDLGARLVADKVYRYLSATIDLTRNVLRSISLVNFPAVKGLAPVELAEADFFVALNSAETVPPTQLLDTPDHTAVVVELTSEVLDMTDEIKTEVVAAPVTAVQPTPAPAQTMLSENELTGLRKQMEAEIKATLLSEFNKLEQEKARMMTELMEQVREERSTAEFSQHVTSDGRNALPFTADEVKDLLANLPKQHRAAVKDALQRIYDNGTVDFTERGTAKGGAPKRIAPDLAQALRNFIRSGGTVATFFEANTELGAMKDYDLAEFGG